MRGDYQDLVEEAAGLLGAPATLEDRDFTLLAFCAHEGEADPVRARSILSRRSTADVRAWFEQFGISTAEGPVRIPPRPESGVLGRLCLPARHEGVTYGYLWLIDQDPEGGGWDAAALRRGMAVAERAGALMAGEAHAGFLLGAELGRLLAGTAAERRAAAFTLGSELGLPEGAPYAVASVRTPGTGGPPGVVRALPGRAVVWAAPDGEGAAYHESVLLMPVRGASGAGPVAEAAGRLMELLARRAPDGPAASGVSAVHHELPDARRALRQARAAAAAASADPGLGPVARWDAIGPYRVLAELPPGAAEDPVLAPLLTPSHEILVRTVEVYLDRAGHAQQAAQELSIHRQTLYYRLSRVEQLTGLDLDRGEDRLLLHMAVKARRLGGARPWP
ncbi:helix-turn-helix domain-containing protein [Streptomyces capparidis]